MISSITQKASVWDSLRRKRWRISGNRQRTATYTLLRKFKGRPVNNSVWTLTLHTGISQFFKCFFFRVNKIINCFAFGIKPKHFLFFFKVNRVDALRRHSIESSTKVCKNDPDVINIRKPQSQPVMHAAKMPRYTSGRNSREFFRYCNVKKTQKPLLLEVCLNNRTK